MVVPRIDYEKVDPWIKKNPKTGTHTEFLKENRGCKISVWSFKKRRAKILGLPMTPSMMEGYRPNKTVGPTASTPKTRISNNLYSTVLSIPTSDLDKKSGIGGVVFLIDKLNETLGLNLQMTEIEIMGSGVKQYELRKYSKEMACK